VAVKNKKREIICQDACPDNLTGKHHVDSNRAFFDHMSRALISTLEQHLKNQAPIKQTNNTLSIATESAP
jgi:hypothetical protein